MGGVGNWIISNRDTLAKIVDPQTIALIKEVLFVEDNFRKDFDGKRQ
jgi:hypothetical protein